MISTLRGWCTWKESCKYLYN